MSTCNLVVLRPYGPRIRNKMFDILALVGIEPQPENILPATMSDDEVIKALGRMRADALLCPFHAVKDDSGRMSNGLVLLQKLDLATSRFRHTPILMPVSKFSTGSYEASTRMPHPELGKVPKSLKDRIMKIDEIELNKPELMSIKVENHIQRRYMAA